MKESWTIPIILLAILLIIACVCCLCLAIGSVTSYLYTQYSGQTGLFASNSTPSPTPVVIRPTPITSPTAQPENSSSNNQPPREANTSEEYSPANTLQTLADISIPISDLVDLAHRLKGITDVQLIQAAPPFPLQVGEQRSFWVSNTDTNVNFQVQATLRHITDHAYFWIENEVEYKEQDLEKLADTFENQIYPTDRAFFGSEWTPGVDNDPHIYILYASNLGETVAGYFSSVDVYPPTVHQYSNWHEMFIFNADNVSFDEEFTYGVLSHEFQHMIHWYRDRNEDTWLNEGFSDLAMLLNNYSIGGHDAIYALNPDIQLNDWPTDKEATMPNYGAAFLFMTYFLDRFGDETTKALVAEQENGLQSIDALLKKLDITDPVNGKPIQADDFYTDWVLTNYLHDDNIADGRYTYHIYPGAPQTGRTESITDCTSNYYTRDVHQYGVDYIRIKCPKDSTLQFEGSTQVGVVPVDPHSESFAFWSNKGDESDMTLTRSFDFTNQTGELSFSYWTWFDLEKDYDYAYLEASTDGENWQMLNTPSGTAENPTGNNFGWAYNGISGGIGENTSEAHWIQETVDISQFAGQKVQLRFEYVTDAAVNGEGMLLDDIAIPQANYQTDFEKDDGGWEANGFIRLQNALPQTFRLALITVGQKTTVEYLVPSPDISLQVPLHFDNDVEEVILVVCGTTRYTRQPATYRLYFTP